MAPATLASSSGWEDASSEFLVKMSRNGLHQQEQPATPTAKPKGLPMRASAEKYNPNPRLRPRCSPAVPEADLHTSNLAIAFPGFSGVADIHALSPNPFVDPKPVNKATTSDKSLQPQVRDENDVSILSQPSAATANIGKKNTRFGNVFNPKIRKGVRPHMYMVSPGLVQPSAAMSAAEEPKPMAINAQGSLTSMPNGSSQPTLNLPQGSNLTDLFSGMIRQPPPVVPQPTRPRSSRFASVTKTQTAAEPKAEQVPVPHNERQLLHSIELLQNRVKELETEKKALHGRKRSDSGVAAPDEDNMGASHRKLNDEKKRLESTCWALQDQQDLLVRDLDTADISIKSLEQDCMEYAAQLAHANSTIERLRDERDQLDQRCAQAVAQLDEALTNDELLTEEIESLRTENKGLKAQIAIFTQAPTAAAILESQHSIHHTTFADDSGPMDMDTLSKMHWQNEMQQQKTQPKPTLEKGKEPALADNANSDSSHDITYLSVANETSLCNVRKTLEQERKARQQRRLAQPSAKLPTSRTDEQNAPQDPTAGEHSHLSESSVIQTRPKRHVIPQEQMTSAFILPDITMNVQPTLDKQAPVQTLGDAKEDCSKVAHKSIFQDTAEGSDILDYEPVAQKNAGSHSQEKQPMISDGQLPTISDEELDITIQEDEPTIRPTQPPEAALATVLESLTTELAAQRARLAKYQTSYDRHDVSISRRQRKQILEKIQALLRSTDTKADQIYNLHDVIEGQKQKGQPITQTQVDNTMQSLGLDLPWEGIESTNASRRRSTASSHSI
ncbi:MAG: hypothetical protein L6R37_000048 [Teloschistes peruensis]|nr:MAG: hypothetical protein L6R37_000048 [Teloschistes peruensis]